MTNNPSETIVCPACGQKYSVEITPHDQEVTCHACHALFKISGSIQKQNELPKKPAATTSGFNSSATAAKTNSKNVRSTGFLDKFMNFLFRLGKTFAGILALVCLLCVFASLVVFACNLKTGLEIPKYEDIVNTAQEDSDNMLEDNSDLDESRAIEKLYGDQVADLVKEAKMQKEDYDGIMAFVKKLKDDYRPRYVDGLENALDKHSESDKKTYSSNDILSMYTDTFLESIEEYELQKESSSTTRWYSLGAVFVSCFMLFMMLIIPALIKIEENTRKGI